jgi:hypothetical protein
MRANKRLAGFAIGDAKHLAALATKGERHDGVSSPYSIVTGTLQFGKVFREVTEAQLEDRLVGCAVIRSCIR